jgi:hypothetical protein
MNLNRVPDRTVEEIRLLVENEVREVDSPAIAEGIQALLIASRLEMRTWDWHKPLTD